MGKGSNEVALIRQGHSLALIAPASTQKGLFLVFLKPNYVLKFHFNLKIIFPFGGNSSFCVPLRAYQKAGQLKVWDFFLNVFFIILVKGCLSFVLLFEMVW